MQLLVLVLGSWVLPWGLAPVSGSPSWGSCTARPASPLTLLTQWTQLSRSLP